MEDPTGIRGRRTAARVRLLAELVEANKPQLIVGYGKGNWDLYEDIVPNIEWTTDPIGPTAIRHGHNGSTTVVLVTGPTHPSMNSATAAIADRVKELLQSG